MDNADILKEFEKVLEDKFGNISEEEEDQLLQLDFGYFDQVKNKDKGNTPPPIPTDVKKKNDLYCDCDKPVLVKAMAGGKTYDYCRGCKKEKK